MYNLLLTPKEIHNMRREVFRVLSARHGTRVEVPETDMLRVGGDCPEPLARTIKRFQGRKSVRQDDLLHFFVVMRGWALRDMTTLATREKWIPGQRSLGHLARFIGVHAHRTYAGRCEALVELQLPVPRVFLVDRAIYRWIMEDGCCYGGSVSIARACSVSHEYVAQRIQKLVGLRPQHFRGPGPAGEAHRRRSWEYQQDKAIRLTAAAQGVRAGVDRARCLELAGWAIPAPSLVNNRFNNLRNLLLKKELITPEEHAQASRKPGPQK